MISTNSSYLFINKIVLHREADFLTGRSAGTCLNWQLGPPEGLSYSRADLEDKQGVSTDFIFCTIFSSFHFKTEVLISTQFEGPALLFTSKKERQGYVVKNTTNKKEFILEIARKQINKWLQPKDKSDPCLKQESEDEANKSIN